MATNPQFLRHVRSDLRMPRVLTTAGVALVVCFVIFEAHSQFLGARYSDPRLALQPHAKRSIDDTLFYWFIWGQAIVLPLWSLLSCIQSIAGERQMKTYDFVRTTRMTSWELLIGYLFGAPILAFAAMGTTAIVSFFIGLVEGIPVTAITASYAILFAFTIFVSLLGLLVSLLVDRARVAGLVFVVLVGAVMFSVLSYASAGSPFPGLIALGITPGLTNLYESRDAGTVPFFGAQVPTLLVSFVLYLSLSAWVALAVWRNLKKDREEVRLFSNLQAVCFSVYANVFLLGFVSPNTATQFSVSFSTENATIVFLAVNLMIFYAVGLATLTPAERLKIWYRGVRDVIHRTGPMFSNDTLFLPWVVVAALITCAGYATLVFLLREIAPADDWLIQRVLVSILILFLFAVRDLLFIQWLLLTRLRNTLPKAVGIVTLYYICMFLISNFWNSPPSAELPLALSAFTPASAFDRNVIGDAQVGGMMFQSLLICVLLTLIFRRLSRSPLDSQLLAVSNSRA